MDGLEANNLAQPTQGFSPAMIVICQILAWVGTFRLKIPFQNWWRKMHFLKPKGWIDRVVEEMRPITRDFVQKNCQITRSPRIKGMESLLIVSRVETDFTESHGVDDMRCLVKAFYRAARIEEFIIVDPQIVIHVVRNSDKDTDSEWIARSCARDFADN